MTGTQVSKLWEVALFGDLQSCCDGLLREGAAPRVCSTVDRGASRPPTTSGFLGLQITSPAIATYLTYPILHLWISPSELPPSWFKPGRPLDQDPIQPGWRLVSRPQQLERARTTLPPIHRAFEETPQQQDKSPIRPGGELCVHVFATI